jgi:DNA-binding PadR family transcriptional regulator
MYRLDTSTTRVREARVLEFAILGLLHQSPMHGYELRKQLSQVL